MLIFHSLLYVYQRVPSPGIGFPSSPNFKKMGIPLAIKHSEGKPIIFDDFPMNKIHLLWVIHCYGNVRLISHAQSFFPQFLQGISIAMFDCWRECPINFP
jgi:hypothetical protein